MVVDVETYTPFVADCPVVMDTGVSVTNMLLVVSVPLRRTSTEKLLPVGRLPNTIFTPEIVCAAGTTNRAIVPSITCQSTRHSYVEEPPEAVHHDTTDQFVVRTFPEFPVCDGTSESIFGTNFMFGKFIG